MAGMYVDYSVAHTALQWTGSGDGWALLCLASDRCDDAGGMQWTRPSGQYRSVVSPCMRLVITCNSLYPLTDHPSPLHIARRHSLSTGHTAGRRR